MTGRWSWSPALQEGGAFFWRYLPDMPESARPRIFLVDGYALIYRAFFAMISRPLRTSRGENTSAAWGVANFLHRLLEERKPEYIAWVHDAGTSFRTDTYPDYKATREKLDDELQEDFDRSVQRIEGILRGFRVPLVAVDGYEADDVIGTLATQAPQHGLQAVIVSGDKDFYQLVSDDVVLLNPGRGGPAPVEEVLIDAANAAERFGVPPGRVIDYLALVGDASDNVPGVKGIGDKTARALISTYGDLGSILRHAAEVKGKRARDGLVQFADDARLSRELVTIRTDVPVQLDLGAFQVGDVDSAALALLYTELEFSSLLSKLEVQSGGFAERQEVKVVSDPRELPVVVKAARKAASLALEVIAEGRAVGSRLVGLGIAIPDGSAWYLPFGHRVPEGELTTDQPPRNLPALGVGGTQCLAELLADQGVAKLGHDLKHAWLALRAAGVELAGATYDSMLASFVLDPGRRSHALEALATEHLNTVLSTATDLIGKGKSTRSLSEVGVDVMAASSCANAWAVLSLHDRFKGQLDAAAARTLLERVEVPLIGVLADMEWRGIRIDSHRLRQLSKRFSSELKDIERSIFDAAGTDFNVNSTRQLRQILFDKLQLPVLKRTKTGPSTDAGVLSELAEMGFDVPRLLLEYRELSKLKSTYVDVLPGSVNRDTGRIHTSFNQTGAATGRLSSSNPNLQNIPVRTARGELIRQCFVPQDGCSFIAADYSQIELRVLAHLSQDAAFIEAFQQGGDIHRQTAAIIFDVEPHGVTPEMRGRAKTINFATIYGQGPFSLARQLSISQEEAKEFIKLYFRRFAGVRRFLDETVQNAKRIGYVETLFGRRRYIPELKDRNYNVRAFGERTAMNSPVQGSAADLIKIAMVNLATALKENGLRSAMLLQVHDELVLEVPNEEVDRAVEIVRREMQRAARLSVPLVADVGIGPNWLDAKSQDG
ncbi:MAG: DNA polymerase I [Gemmatimonadota bacterium]|nr:MAG: DNA polymerase I [Gemmatimonadota bacterium]